jgi:hypothetical protein
MVKMVKSPLRERKKEGKCGRIERENEQWETRRRIHLVLEV